VLLSLLLQSADVLPDRLVTRNPWVLCMRSAAFPCAHCMPPFPAHVRIWSLPRGRVSYLHDSLAAGTRRMPMSTIASQGAAACQFCVQISS